MTLLSSNEANCPQKWGGNKDKFASRSRVLSQLHFTLTLWVPRVININFLLIIPIHYQKKRLWDLIKWSALARKCFDLLSNSLNYFFKEMYRDQLEPICVWILELRVKNHQLRRLRIRMFAVWEANLTLHKKDNNKTFPAQNWRKKLLHLHFHFCA